METKECRHCRQPIHKDARRCQHCHGHQSWISDQTDPRMMAGMVVFFVALGLLAFVAVTRTAARLDPTESSRESLRPSVAVSDVSYRFGKGNNADQVYVMGEVANSSDVDAADVFLRIDLRDREGKLVDSFMEGLWKLVIPARVKTRFRTTTSTPIAPEDVARIEVAVERARKADKWSY
ncbi:MAG: hypothetical protein HY897_12365 [Deltaproteobacteria bacterium]|nr:hypothetical protein [Deltaproteobacteria bacterium]